MTGRGIASAPGGPSAAPIMLIRTFTGALERPLEHDLRKAGVRTSMIGAREARGPNRPATNLRQALPKEYQRSIHASNSARSGWSAR